MPTGIFHCILNIAMEDGATPASLLLIKVAHSYFNKERPYPSLTKGTYAYQQMQLRSLSMGDVRIQICEMPFAEHCHTLQHTPQTN